MFYIVGLGNPGQKYENTRHNVGWILLDRMIAAVGLPAPYAASKYAGRVSEGVLYGSEVTVLYPDTFMNKSGSAVAKLVPKDQAAQLMVVYDDVDLPVGEVKVSFGRGAGGHNGVTSIINSLGTKDFIRIRVGISPTSFWTGKTKRPSGDRLPKYVLGQFTKRELSQLDPVADTVQAIIETCINDGVEKAMNRHN